MWEHLCSICGQPIQETDEQATVERVRYHSQCWWRQHHLVDSRAKIRSSEKRISDALKRIERARRHENYRAEP